MTINGWDINEADAKLARFVNSHHEITNSSEWSEGGNRPVFQKGKIGFKTFTAELWVHGNGYDDIVENRGKILSHLLDEAVLMFDGHTHKFKAVLTKYSVDEKSKQKWHILKLVFIGYEYSEPVEYQVNVDTSFLIDNIGTAETPVTLELVVLGGPIEIPPDQMKIYILCDDDGSYITDDDGIVIGSYDSDTLVIEGLCRDSRTGESLDIEIRNTTPGKKIIIDGDTGLITEDGVVKIDDVDIWALPSIVPGENQIVTNNNWLDVKVRYEPRYM